MSRDNRLLNIICILLCGSSNCPQIRSVCEYSETTESAEWTISYGGERMDITESGDQLALSLLKGVTDSVCYDYNNDEELPNRLRLPVKK